MPCCPGLALLAAWLAAGIGEVSPRVLEPGRSRGQVTVGLHAIVGAGERLAQAVQRSLGTLAVALREARHGIAKGLARRSVCLAGLSLELRQLAGERVALLLGHLVDLVAERADVLPGLLRVTGRVRLCIARRRP